MGDFGSLPRHGAAHASIEQLTRALCLFRTPTRSRPSAEGQPGLVLKVWFDFVLRTADIDTQPSRDFIQSAAIPALRAHCPAGRGQSAGLVVIWASYRIMWATASAASSPRVCCCRACSWAPCSSTSRSDVPGRGHSEHTLCDVIIKFDTIADWPSWWRTFSINPQDGVLQVVTTMALVLGYDVLAVAYVVRYTVPHRAGDLRAPRGPALRAAETGHLAKMWRKLFVTNLFMQPIQLFVIAIGFALENTGAVPLRHVFALAALLVVFKVPGAMGSAEKIAHKLESMLSSSFTHAKHSAARAL